MPNNAAGKQSTQRTDRYRLRFRSIASSGASLMVISSLLYAGVFVEKKAVVVEIERPAIERRDMFYGVLQPQADVVWAVGNIGKIVRSQDRGETWHIQDSGTRANLQDLAAWGLDRAVSVGNEGVIVMTNDAGLTWTAVATNVDLQGIKLLKVEALEGGEAWATGERGTVLVSRDFGSSWRSVGTDEDVAWNGVTFFEGTGILVGEFGRIRVSHDTGVTWRDVDSPVDSSLYAVQLRSKSKGLAVGSEGVILYTRDGGRTWKRRSAPAEEHLFDVLWDDGRWLTVGNNGAVLVANAPAEDWENITGIAGTGWHTQISGGGGQYLLGGHGIQEVTVSPGKKNKGEAE